MRLSLRRVLWTHFIALNFAAGVLPENSRAGGPRAPWTRRTTVEKLADKIDKLEHQIDEYGTVVAKSPDVWGEARLTKYRREYETVMFKRLEGFTETINAAISRSDQAYLTSALSLQAAISGDAAVLSRPEGLVGTTGSATTTETFEKINPPSAPGENTFFSNELKAESSLFSRSDAKTVTSRDFVGIKKDVGIALEPSIMLDQQTRYLNHLMQLRRNNDGDDSSDSPGYGLHLVRIPVSILPGRLTKEGYGAEVSVIAKPYLHEKLLPTTFKGLVINDLVDQLSFPLIKIADLNNAEAVITALKKYDPSVKPLTPEEIQKHQRTLQEYEQERELLQQLISQKEKLEKLLKSRANKELKLAELQTRSNEIKEKLFSRLEAIDDETTKVAVQDEILQGIRSKGSQLGALSRSMIDEERTEFLTDIQQFDKDNKTILGLDEKLAFDDRQIQQIETSLIEVKSALRELSTTLDVPLAAFDSMDEQQRLSEEDKEKIREQVRIIDGKIKPQRQLVDLKNSEKERFESIERLVNQMKSIPPLSLSPSRRAQMPFFAPRLFANFGHRQVGYVAELIFGLKSDEIHGKRVLILDAQKMLAEALEGAYELLRQHPDAWPVDMQMLVSAVRRNDNLTISHCRGEFINHFLHVEEKDFATVALAWAIVVESALLNQRLIDDMDDMRSAKNCVCLSTDWMPYYLPNPPPEASANFNQYVECRWPVHVFAIDPMTDDQNVADSFSQRREMQLALSLALTNGSIGVQKFMRYARRLELDMQTIALNRTIVGFSHGDDTFGWRFYPRVQSPPSPGNLAVAVNDLLIGGYTKDQELNFRRLEPGPRECVAIVLMPEFVPYVHFDVRSNWFRLGKKFGYLHKRQFDLEDTVEFSKDVTELRELAQACVKDEHKYRPNEVYRLTRSMEQLERKLPLQTHIVQMPFENSLGGFEFFNGGAPNLAPELHGFYGEPGINNQGATTFFLVGDNFSVHETKIIVGNQDVTGDSTLISRQVIQVTVKAKASAVGETVDVHVATPYGVSNHLLIPLAASESAAISAHEAEKHQDNYGWETRPDKTIPVPTLVVGIQDGNVIEAKFDQPSRSQKLTILHTGPLPDPLKDLFYQDKVGVPLTAQPMAVDLALWITVKSADAATADKQYAVGPWSKLLKQGFLITELEAEIEKALVTKLPNGFNPKTMELQGYVRLPQGHDTPTFKMINKVQMKVVQSQLLPCCTPNQTEPADSNLPFEELPSPPAPGLGELPDGPAMRSSPFQPNSHQKADLGRRPKVIRTRYSAASKP